MVESQAARMGHDDDRDAAPGSVPPALATSGLELETSCSTHLARGSPNANKIVHSVSLHI